MKVTTIIDNKLDEEVLIHAKERRKLIDDIEELCQLENKAIIGVYDGEAYKLIPNDICYFETDNNTVTAVIGDNQYKVREKLYQLEEIFLDNFIKINQSKLVNIRKIKKFSSTIGGSIMVTFENNKSDYISRRCLKTVKERMGL